jgi:hypothetical protein
VELLVRYEFSHPIADLELASTFFELGEIGHETLCRIHLDGRVQAFLLNVNSPSLRIQTKSGQDKIVQRELEFTLITASLLLLDQRSVKS